MRWTCRAPWRQRCHRWPNCWICKRAGCGWCARRRAARGELYRRRHRTCPRPWPQTRAHGWHVYCLDTYRAGDMAGAANINVITCSRLKSLVGRHGWIALPRQHSAVRAAQKLGVLNVASTDWRELSADDLRLLYTVGDLVSIADPAGAAFAQSGRYGRSKSATGWRARSTTRWRRGWRRSCCSSRRPMRRWRRSQR